MAFHVTATHYYKADLLQSLSGYSDSNLFTGASSDVADFISGIGAGNLNRVKVANFTKIKEFWDVNAQTDIPTGQPTLGFKVDVIFERAEQ